MASPRVPPILLSRMESGVDPQAAKPTTCSRCGAVMGVYEPLVCLVEGRLRRSSRAADPELLKLAAACHHATCFERSIEAAVDAA
jgi:hypothetical protein